MCTKEYYKLYARRWRARNKEHLKEYRRKLYLKNRPPDRPRLIVYTPEQRLENSKRWKREHYRKNKERLCQQARDRHKRNRAIVIEAYGGKCTCCGESTPEFLAIDHINGRDKGPRGQGDNKLGFQMYAWLIRNKFPKHNYRLHCSNCNNARAWFGICPHERDRNQNAIAAD